MQRARTKTVVMEGVLDANDALAQTNRETFEWAGVYVINVMSSPGAGKTTILERTLEQLAQLVLINKVDLLPHLDFDLDLFPRNLDAVNPGVPRMLMSARTGEGVADWRAWLSHIR